MKLSGSMHWELDCRSSWIYENGVCQHLQLKCPNHVFNSVVFTMSCTLPPSDAYYCDCTNIGSSTEFWGIEHCNGERIFEFGWKLKKLSWVQDSIFYIEVRRGSARALPRRTSELYTQSVRSLSVSAHGLRPWFSAPKWQCHSNFWTFGLSDFRAFGLLDFRV